MKEGIDDEDETREENVHNKTKTMMTERVQK